MYELDLEGRVTRLEGEMAEVRFLATNAERDVADVKTVLIGHTGLLNALREDQVDQGRTLARLDREMRGTQTDMRTGFAEMRRGFAVLGEGQARISELLDQHIRESGACSG
jgi:hypothetical protein